MSERDRPRRGAHRLVESETSDPITASRAHGPFGRSLSSRPYDVAHRRASDASGATPTGTVRGWPPATNRTAAVDRNAANVWFGRGNGASLLAAASCLLLLLAAAQGYVSFRAQYAFVDHAKRAHLPSILEALGLDTGAVIFALLALSLARRGRRGTVERVLNVACALGSLTMNLLAADLTSPRSVTVWVLPSALYALASDRLIAVVRRWVLTTDPGAEVAPEGPVWRAFGGLVLWMLRLLFDPPGTVTGFRRWVLAVAPVAPGVRTEGPSAAGALPAGDDSHRKAGRPSDNGEREPAKRTAHREPPGQSNPSAHNALPHLDLAPGEKKRHALIRLYERCGQTGDPRYGDRARTAELAGQIAARIGYHPGTARRELAKYLATQPEAPAGSQPQAGPSPQSAADAEAVS